MTRLFDSHMEGDGGRGSEGQVLTYTPFYRPYVVSPVSLPYERPFLMDTVGKFSKIDVGKTIGACTFMYKNVLSSLEFQTCLNCMYLHYPYIL